MPSIQDQVYIPDFQKNDSSTSTLQFILNSFKYFDMKKVITFLGSLMIIAGLKAQNQPTIKKETAPAVKTTGLDSLKSKSALPGKQSPASSKLSPVNPNQASVPSKISPVVKPDKTNPAALPSKDAPVTKPTKQ